MDACRPGHRARRTRREPRQWGEKHVRGQGMGGGLEAGSTAAGLSEGAGDLAAFNAAGAEIICE